MSRLPLRLAVALAPVLAACGGATGDESAPAAGTESPYPEGTVLAINGFPITAEEVDPIAASIAGLYPEHSLPHRRRLALTNAVLPVYALRASAPEARERALAEAREVAAALAEAPDRIPDGALPPQRRSGTHVDLGLDLFAAVENSQPGRWSPPLEVAGRIVLVRPAEAPAQPLPDLPTQARTLDFDLYEFPYQWPPGGGRTLDDYLDASHLEVVDPDWDEIVPGQWKHRMRPDR